MKYKKYYAVAVFSKLGQRIDTNFMSFPLAMDFVNKILKRDLAHDRIISEIQVIYWDEKHIGTVQFSKKIC